ncbi:MAG: anthranilate phosphoribosyltransferase [Planctomycetes bacterium]|nr:anthranilate phosphoribosyltransferase [Planctomycetota bacterium]
MGTPVTPLQPSEFPRQERPGDLTPFLRLLISGQTLTIDQAQAAFGEMMGGQSHPAEVGALLALLARRLPTVEELTGAVLVMRSHVTALKTSIDPSRILDTAGTGGAPKAFNASTLAAIIAASQGVHVAKHGNRSRTGRGSAEVLEVLGLPLELGLEGQRRCLEQAHFAFCFAPNHHPAARHAMPIRKALGFPTIFNLVGPLTNPAYARRQVVGVYDRAFVPLIASVLRELGTEHALVYHGLDGLDEMTTGASTLLAEVKRTAQGGSVHMREITPESVGVRHGNPLSVSPTSLPEAAQLFRDVLSGRAASIAMEMSVINAAAALVAGGCAENLTEGTAFARKSIASGAAGAALERLITVARSA